MFSVSSGDNDTKEVFYRHVPIDSTLKSRVIGDYSANYPRELAFDPTILIVVTWKLDNNQSISGQVITKVSRFLFLASSNGQLRRWLFHFLQKDVFQLVIANGGNRSLVYYFYNMTEWAMNGDGYASVKLKSCGYDTWFQQGSNTTAISNISLMQSNVDVPGMWLFLINDKGKIIHPG